MTRIGIRALARKKSEDRHFKTKLDKFWITDEMKEKAKLMVIQIL